MRNFGVAIGTTTTKSRDMGGCVFADAGFRVVHADDDERFDQADGDEVVGRVADVPVHARDERGCAVEKILAVVKIKDGKVARGLIVVAGRKIDDEIALVSKEARAKTFMLA